MLMPINEVIRLSISEGAKLFGVNAQTIRRAIKSEELTYIVVQGRYKISFESLVKWSQRHTTINNKMETRGIGQYVGQWKIRNKLYSPNPQQTQPAVPPAAGPVQQQLLVPQQKPSTPASTPINPTLPF